MHYSSTVPILKYLARTQNCFQRRNSFFLLTIMFGPPEWRAGGWVGLNGRLISALQLAIANLFKVRLCVRLSSRSCRWQIVSRHSTSHGLSPGQLSFVLSLFYKATDGKCECKANSGYFIVYVLCWAIMEGLRTNTQLTARKLLQPFMTAWWRSSALFVTHRSRSVLRGSLWLCVRAWPSQDIFYNIGELTMVADV